MTIANSKTRNFCEDWDHGRIPKTCHFC